MPDVTNQLTAKLVKNMLLCLLKNVVLSSFVASRCIGFVRVLRDDRCEEGDK